MIQQIQGIAKKKNNLISTFLKFWSGFIFRSKEQFFKIVNFNGTPSTEMDYKIFKYIDINI